jgi:(2Fe-2S) ferredoxin
MLGAGAAVLLLLAAGGAKADGLERFKKLLNAEAGQVLVFKSAKALGDNGFVLEDVTITPPPEQTSKAEPVQVKRIAVEDLDFASIEKKASPNFARVRAEGIAIAGKMAEGVDLKELAGIDNVIADFQLDYRLDPDRKTLTLNRLEFDLNGLGRFELTMILDGVSQDMAGQPSSAMDNATLRTASFVYEDHSLLAKSIPAAAKSQNMDPNAAVGMAKGMLDGLKTGQGPEAQAILDAVVAYVADYKQPKGPLRVTLNPTSKTSAASVGDLKSADEAIKSLGIVVSYAGAPAAAPSGSAKVASAPAASSPAAGGKAGCQPGGRVFVYREDAWWAATARDASKSGKECITRIEGESDDIVIASDKLMAWSIDGPGNAVTKCKAGSKVLVLYKDGGWYPAEVTEKPYADGQCPVKYESDDDEAKVELKKVRRLD